MLLPSIVSDTVLSGHDLRTHYRLCGAPRLSTYLPGLTFFFPVFHTYETYCRLLSGVLLYFLRLCVPPSLCTPALSAFAWSGLQQNRFRFVCVHIFGKRGKQKTRVGKHGTARHSKRRRRQCYLPTWRVVHPASSHMQKKLCSPQHTQYTLCRCRGGWGGAIPAKPFRHGYTYVSLGQASVTIRFCALCRRMI